MSKDDVTKTKTTWLDVPKVCLVRQYNLKKGVQEVEAELAKEVVRRKLGTEVPAPTKAQIENAQPPVGEIEVKTDQSKPEPKGSTNP
jgi:hypothetical protein